MNAMNENLGADPLDDLPEVDAFSTSLAPINRNEQLLFGLRDRICCIGLMATFVALMRIFLSN